MDSGIVCACCGNSISFETLPECDYCGYINVGTMDGAEDPEITEPRNPDAVSYRKDILKMLKDISVVTHQYKWDEESMKFTLQSRKEIRIADGEQCDGQIVWSAQGFAQNPDSAEPVVLEVKYQYDGEVKEIQYPIRPVRGENFWNVGVEVNAHLKIVFHLGDENHIARGGEIPFANPRVSCSDEFFSWGPRRPLYPREQVLMQPVFNSVVDHTEAGDERYFVRIAEKNGDGDRDYCGDIELEAGKQYEVYIAFHNDADRAYNEKKYGYKAAACNTRLSSSFPDALGKGEQGVVKGTFSSTNSVPPAIWAGAYMKAKEPVTLAYVTGSAKIHNKWEADGSVMSTSLFSDIGTFVGLNKLNGVIPGGDIYSLYVTYTIQTTAAK